MTGKRRGRAANMHTRRAHFIALSLGLQVDRLIGKA